MLQNRHKPILFLYIIGGKQSLTKRIVLFTLGGTISAKGQHRTDLKDYTSGLIDGKNILQAIPEINDIAHVEVVQIDNVSSTQMNEMHWFHLKREIEYYLEVKDYDGIVITHGTSTLEETAYFLHLTVHTYKPIVLVGAQRPFTALSTDVHLNLLNAFYVAVDPNSYNKGVLVVLNNEISSARDVTKVQTYRLNAFHSSELGFLGIIDGDHSVQYYRSPTRRHTKISEFSKLKHPKGKLPAVEIIYSYAGATGELIKYVAASGKYDGIVIAGTGAGRFSKVEEEALKIARDKGLHIVRSSRVGTGRVVDIKPYESLGAISGDNLLPQKARILLMLSLLKSNDRSFIQHIFATH